MSEKRTIVLVSVLGGVAVVALLAWMLSSRIQSPAEAAARTAPPEPSPILVPVEKRALSSRIIMRGTARFGLPQPLSIAPSSLKTTPGLITTLPKRNAQLGGGDVLLTASGRPALILQGAIPAYRDLVPGSTGKDVQQLEEALKRLGFDPGPIDGKYDAQTSDAVARWYEDGGWEPQGPTPEQIAWIRDIEKQLGDATKNKLAAESAAAAADLAVASARSSAEQNDKVAAADVHAKQAALERAKIEIENTATALEAARVTAEHKQSVAAAELAKSQSERARLIAESEGKTPLAVEVAAAQADHANKVAKADMAAKIYDRALIVLDPRQTQTARDAADANLEMARASALKVQLEGELAVHGALRDAAVAKATFGLAEAAVKSAELEGKAAIHAARIAHQSAQQQVTLAEQQLELAKGAVTATELAGKEAARAALDAQKLAVFDAELATKRAEQLTSDLEAAQAKLGVQLPADEIVFIPALPVRVEQVTAVVGDKASGSVMSVTDLQLRLDAALPLDAAPLVKVGMPVTIDEQTLGIQAKGTVAMVADTPGTHGVDGYHIYMEVRVDEATTPLEGFSLRLTIPIESTEGEVIAVPTSAVTLSADGTSRIQVERDGTLEFLVVEPGLAADGFVQVTPVEGRLEPGDLVVIGFEYE